MEGPASGKTLLLLLLVEPAMDKAAQRVMRSMVQWGLLRDEAEKGVYARGSEMITVSGDLAELLLEGLLISEEKAMPVEQIGSHPVLFPFDLRFTSHGLRQSPRFQVYRQGLDTDVVSLADLPVTHHAS